MCGEDLLYFVATRLFETWDEDTQRIMARLSKHYYGEFRCRVTRASATTSEGLAQLSHLPALEFCTLKGAFITDLAPLAIAASQQHGQLQRAAWLPFARLRHLVVTNASVKDLGPVGALTQLTALQLVSLQATDIEGLANLLELKCLQLTGLDVARLEPISPLAQLEKLDLQRLPVTSLEPLSSLHRLQSLQVSNTCVRDLAPLATLTKLRSISLIAANVADLGPLAALEQLGYLGIFNAPPSNLAPVASLTHLLTLSQLASWMTELQPLVMSHPIGQMHLGGTSLYGPQALAGLPRLLQMFRRGLKEIGMEIEREALSGVTQLTLCYGCC